MVVLLVLLISSGSMHALSWGVELDEWMVRKVGAEPMPG